MQQYRIVWQAFPLSLTKPQVLFVEAEQEHDALDIAVDHVERKTGTPRDRFRIMESGCYEPPAVKGRVIPTDRFYSKAADAWIDLTEKDSD
jgi:hypothetical protein